MRRMCPPIPRSGKSNTALGHFVPRLAPDPQVKMVLMVYIPRRRRYLCAGGAGQSRGGTPAASRRLALYGLPRLCYSQRCGGGISFRAAPLPMSGQGRGEWVDQF